MSNGDGYDDIQNGRTLAAHLYDVISEDVTHERECMRSKFLVDDVGFLKGADCELVLNEATSCLIQAKS